MTEGPESPETPEPGETPAIAEVRRLLAAARHTDPMPDDVAARLDDVLAGLRRGEREGAEVISLESRRRRRVGGWLVAAAAAVVGAVVVVPHLPSSNPATTNAGTPNAASDAAPSDNALSNTGDGHAPPGPRSSRGYVSEKSPSIVRGRVVVHPRRFTADARSVQSALSAGYTALDATRPVSQCLGAPAGARRVPAEYQHTDAALVFRRVQGGSQMVELYVCGRPGPVRSVALPAP